MRIIRLRKREVINLAECYADYYTDKNKILTMLEYGNPKERQIALGSLVIHFGKEDHYDLCWRIFLSDEHMDVKHYALGKASHFATTKQLFEIAEYILKLSPKRNDLLYASNLLRTILYRYKDNKL